MVQVELLLFTAGVLLVASTVASRATGRFGVPALLLFLLVGVLAGPEGPVDVPISVGAQLAWNLGVTALALILFSGGLDTRWEDVRPQLAPGVSLAGVGVVVTALVAGLAAWRILDLTLLQGLLLGAVVSSTDAAAVFGVFRSQHVDLRRDVRALLEFESGSNDPMAVFLTVSLVSFLQNPDAGLLGFAVDFLRQMSLGALLGVAAGWAAVRVVNGVRLDAEGLYPALTVGFVLLVYGATSALGGNGFLAVYLAGLVVSEDAIVHGGSIRRFHDGLAWIMQIVMFLALGLLVRPSELAAVALPATLVALVLLLVARPLGVVASLLPFRREPREMALVSWAGLRGAVPIILATFPLLAGLPSSDVIFRVVFFVVVASALVQGPTIRFAARALNLVDRDPPRPPPPLRFAPGQDIRERLTEVRVEAGAPLVGRRLVDLSLPEGTLVVLVGRDDRFLVPRGSTEFQVGDELVVLADAAGTDRVRELSSVTS